MESNLIFKEAIISGCIVFNEQLIKESLTGNRLKFSNRISQFDQ